MIFLKNLMVILPKKVLYKVYKIYYEVGVQEEIIQASINQQEVSIKFYSYAIWLYYYINIQNE